MAITLVNVGTYLNTTSNVTQTISLPSGMQAGDLIILVIACGEDSPQPSVVTPPGGYTQRPVADNFYDYGPAGMSQWCYWKIHSGSESNPSFTLNTGTASGGGIYAYAMAWRGVSTSTPFDVDTPAYGNSSASGSSATFQPPQVTTNSSGSCVVSIVQTSDDNGLNLDTANSFTLSSVTGDSWTSEVGSDSSFGMAYRVVASPSTIDLPIWNQMTLGPDYWAYQTMVFKDASAATTVPGSRTANAIIKRPSGTKTATADAVIKRSSGTKTVTANASILRSTETSITGNAVVFKIQAAGVTADAVRKATSDIKTLAADATISLHTEDAVVSDAVLFKTQTVDFGADAVRHQSAAGSFDADATALRSSGELTFGANSYVTDGSPIVGVPTWVSPPNTEPMSYLPTLVFTMPSFTGVAHFQLQLDTADTFDTVNLREHTTYLDQDGWEYWDGGDWVAIPATGVPDTYAGNQARYSVSTPLTGGTWYRRVRAGV